MLLPVRTDGEPATSRNGQGCPPSWIQAMRKNISLNLSNLLGNPASFTATFRLDMIRIIQPANGFALPVTRSQCTDLSRRAWQHTSSFQNSDLQQQHLSCWTRDTGSGGCQVEDRPYYIIEPRTMQTKRHFLDCAAQ